MTTEIKNKIQELNSLKRYSLYEISRDGESWSEMRENPHGNFIKYSDRWNDLLKCLEVAVGISFNDMYYNHPNIREAAYNKAISDCERRLHKALSEIKNILEK